MAWVARVLLVLGALAVVAVVSSAPGIIGTGSAQTERPGTPLPYASWKAIRVSATAVSTGLITGGSPFRFRTGFGPPVWSTEIKGPRPPRLGAKGSFCVWVSVLGPLIKVPGGGYSAQESGSTECGPINPKIGLVNLSPQPGGSLEQPEGEVETWPTFDVGSVAYPPSVDKVRLRFAGGGSTVLPLRRMPAADRPRTWEPFRYLSIGVYGCVNEVEGLSRGRAVARLHLVECGG